MAHSWSYSWSIVEPGSPPGSLALELHLAPGAWLSWILARLLQAESASWQSGEVTDVEELRVAESAAKVV